MILRFSTDFSDNVIAFVKNEEELTPISLLSLNRCANFLSVHKKPSWEVWSQKLDKGYWPNSEDAFVSLRNFIETEGVGGLKRHASSAISGFIDEAFCVRWKSDKSMQAFLMQATFEADASCIDDAFDYLCENIKPTYIVLNHHGLSASFSFEYIMYAALRRDYSLMRRNRSKEELVFAKIIESKIQKYYTPIYFGVK